ncbi:MAG: phosphoglucosamine mutase, partial [Actinobacteria bacterium]
AAGDDLDGPVVIGADTRRSSPMLVSALEAGFNSVGVDTVELGIVPVGAVSRLARDVAAAYGVMVSASHNPAPDNGIKFFGPDGAKLSDEAELTIESRLFSTGEARRPIGPNVGIQTRMDDAVERYVEKVAKTVQYSMRGLEFAVDCANGAAFAAAPALFAHVGATVEVFNVDPDGLNINNGVGATHPEFLAANAGGRVGLAFDGDADRLIAIDEDGAVVNGDVIMAIFAKWLHERGTLQNDTVVVTVMSNLGFHKAMRDLGISVVETQVGDRYVLEMMRARGGVLGAESSGHMIFLDKHTTGDGIVSALQLLAVMRRTGRSVSALASVLTLSPQHLVNVDVARRPPLQDLFGVQAAIAAAEKELGQEGRVLVRYSGTQNMCRVMVEGPTEEMTARLCDSIATALKNEIG